MMDADGDSEAMNTLRKHLGNDIVFTGVWDDATKERLGVDLLFPMNQKLSAVTFKIGCYTVRIKKLMLSLLLSLGGKFPYNPIISEITAKHNSWGKGVFAGGFKHICRAVGLSASLSWHDRIDFICTLKEDASLSDEHASLFVLNRYMGSSISVENWYRLTPNGAIKKYIINFDSESHEASWKDTETDSGEGED